MKFFKNIGFGLLGLLIIAIVIAIVGGILFLISNYTWWVLSASSGCLFLYLCYHLGKSFYNEVINPYKGEEPKELDGEIIINK